MNETIKNLCERRSVRNFMSILPPPDEINAILECGRHAATAFGKQPWFFSVVRDRGLLDEISAENKRLIMEGENEEAKRLVDDTYDVFRTAPMAIIVSADETAAYGLADAANATQNMAVAAWSLGIGSCYIASFVTATNGEKSEYFRHLLQIPLGFKPVFALALGYASAPLPPRKERVPDRITFI